MNLEQAKLAGILAAGIEKRQAKLAVINQMLTDANWVVTNVTAKSLVTNETVGLILDDLDQATSQAGIDFIKQIYETQIAAMQAALADDTQWLPQEPGP